MRLISFTSDQRTEQHLRDAYHLWFFSEDCVILPNFYDGLVEGVAYCTQPEFEA